MSNETISVRFDILYVYVWKHQLDYNELCRVVRDAIAEGSCAALANSPGRSWVRLADSDWVNIVNSPNVTRHYSPEDAVREVVRMTEARLKELNT